MGAWIEIGKTEKERKAMRVAPHVGAWIEMGKTEKERKAMRVAPHVGAWIEITLLARDLVYHTSHPTWVRGLKSAKRKKSAKRCESHPTWVRGLK